MHKARLAAAAVLAIGTLLGSAVAHAAEWRPWDPKAFGELVAAGKTVLVHVHATWCATCRAQGPTLARIVEDPALAELVPVRVDFDTDKDALERFRVQWQSTVIVFRDRREVYRSTAVTDPQLLETALRRAIAG